MKDCKNNFGVFYGPQCIWATASVAKVGLLYNVKLVRSQVPRRLVKSAPDLIEADTFTLC